MSKPGAREAVRGTCVSLRAPVCQSSVEKQNTRSGFQNPLRLEERRGRPGAPHPPLVAPAAESRRGGLELSSLGRHRHGQPTLSGFPYYFPKVLVSRRTAQDPCPLLVRRWLVLCVCSSGMSGRHPGESAA